MHFPPEMPFSFPPAEVTYYQADEREPWSYAWVGFDGKAVPEILARTVFFRGLCLPEGNTGLHRASHRSDEKSSAKLFSRVQRTNSPPPEISCCSFPL